ncbi:type IV pilus biogenesis protein PihK [Syntrophotalea carbinolica DSM 2380]|uniref:Type IV pilus biogenesis protein PihK n=2 Tax=Syntrophotalea carbinolica TaxID=19 RepID=Q3A683_SYNC1|nr:type IV pilus biogenesis protein PihK [Syntrophotalea carbinolica DSM 2380]
MVVKKKERKFMRAFMPALMLFFFLAVSCGATERSPFDRNPILDYEQAIKGCELQGVVITPKFKRIILRCPENATSLIYESGDKVTVRYGSADHEFRIEEIRPRSVFFRNKKGKQYEVEWK